MVTRFEHHASRCLAFGIAVTIPMLLARCAPLMGIDDVTLWDGAADSQDVANRLDVVDEVQRTSTTEAGNATDEEDGNISGDANSMDRTDDGTSDAPATVPPPTPTLLASGQWGAWNLVVDRTNVYWTNRSNQGQGQVMKVPIDGGSPTVVAAEQDSPLCLAVDESNIYWTNFDSPGTVMTVPIRGGNPTTFATGTYPNGIVVSGAAVFWGESENGGGLRSEPIDGGSSPFLLHTGPGVGAVAVLNDNIFFTSNPWVEMTPIGGGVVTNIGTAASLFWVAVNATHVFWSDASPSGSIFRAPLDGGAQETIVASQNQPSVIALDSTRVYWTDSTAGNVLAAPLDGSGDPLILASGQGAPHGVAVDDTYVYWTTDSYGTVMRLTK
jgi:hypothetical protein